MTKPPTKMYDSLPSRSQWDEYRQIAHENPGKWILVVDTDESGWETLSYNDVHNRVTTAAGGVHRRTRHKYGNGMEASTRKHEDGSVKGFIRYVEKGWET